MTVMANTASQRRGLNGCYMANTAGLERASRGMESAMFSQDRGADTVRILISGFDPFGLSSTSGVARASETLQVWLLYGQLNTTAGPWHMLQVANMADATGQ